MKTFIASAALLISSALLFAAMDQSFINRIAHDRYFDHLLADSSKPRSLYYRTFVRSDRWRYGDLYGLCYLPQYRHELEPFQKYPFVSRRPANRVLYIVGDSFLADKTLTSAFDQFDNVIFLDNRYPYGPIMPDTARQNYILLEFAERNLAGYNFNRGIEVKWTPGQIKRHAGPPVAAGGPTVSLFNRTGRILFNDALSRNLEMILFDDKLFTPIKELKASLNYKLFGRVPPEVAVSTDKKRILLNISVDSGSNASSFRPKSSEDVKGIVRQLDTAASYYRAIGFKDVFLSVVPNAASIYDADRMPYNHLLERVEKQADIPVISIYQEYKTDKRNLFYISDAHWDPVGFSLWVNKTNAYFNQSLK